MDKYDLDKDGSIDFADFVHYVMEHEKGLRLSFAMVDHNQDGNFVVVVLVIVGVIFFSC